MCIVYFLQMFQQGPPISAALTTHSGPHSNTIHDLIGPGSSTASSMGSIVTTSTSTLAAAAIAQSFGVGQPVNSATMSHSPSPRYCKHIKLKMTFYLRLALSLTEDVPVRLIFISLKFQHTRELHPTSLSSNSWWKQAFEIDDTVCLDSIYWFTPTTSININL